MAKKTIELKQGDYRTVWRNGIRGMIDVDVYKGEETTPILEWSYPKVVGPSLLGNANLWLPQAIVQAQA